MKPCKFPGMTAEQYDKNFRELIAICTRRTVFTKFDLMPNGMPAPIGPKAWGMPKLVGMYRPVERAITQHRERARRQRQMKIGASALFLTLFDAPVHPVS